MRTFWPTLKPTLTFGASTRIWRRMRFTSGGSSGTGRVPEPTKPVTPGVLRTTNQARLDSMSSSFSSIICVST